MVLVIYVEPKAAVEGKGFSIPVWPFAMLLSIILVVLASIWNHIPRLIEKWMQTKVEIAKAEHGEDSKEINPTPPAPDKPPTDIAKG